jgi:hypothetical protein
LAGQVGFDDTIELVYMAQTASNGEAVIFLMTFEGNTFEVT